MKTLQNKIEKMKIKIEKFEKVENVNNGCSFLLKIEEFQIMVITGKFDPSGSMDFFVFTYVWVWGCVGGGPLCPLSALSMHM